jgi:hypothetical protein
MPRIESIIVFTKKRRGHWFKPSSSKIWSLSSVEKRQSIASLYKSRSSDTGSSPVAVKFGRLAQLKKDRASPLFIKVGRVTLVQAQ